MRLLSPTKFKGPGVKVRDQVAYLELHRIDLCISQEDMQLANTIEHDPSVKAKREKLKDLYKKYYRASDKKYKLETEVDGLSWEFTICSALGIPYDGEFNYNTQKSIELSESIHPSFIDRFSNFTIHHTAKNQNVHDFTLVHKNTGEVRFLSAKSTKNRRVGKVAPQVLGQSKSRFCETFGLPNDSNESTLVDCVRTRTPEVFNLMFPYTFKNPILYFNLKTNSKNMITALKPIAWEKEKFVFETKTGIKVLKNDKKYNIAEFQVHDTSRKNTCFRWYFETLLELYPDHFEIIDMCSDEVSHTIIPVHQRVV